MATKQEYTRYMNQTADTMVELRATIAKLADMQERLKKAKRFLLDTIEMQMCGGTVAEAIENAGAVCALLYPSASQRKQQREAAEAAKGKEE